MMGVLARNWWVVALRGVFGVALGVAAFAWPDLTLVALVLLFGSYALVDGVFALIATFRAAKAHERWWPFILEGGAGIVAGVVTFMWSGITLLVLFVLIAWWAIITGIFELGAAIRLGREMRGEWTLWLGGLASLVFGVVLLVRPAAGILLVTWLIGTYAMVFGVLLLALGFRLREYAGQKPAQA